MRPKPVSARDPSEEHRGEARRRREQRLEERLPAVAGDHVAGVLERDPPERHQDRRHQRVGLQVGPAALADDREEDEPEDRRRHERDEGVGRRADDAKLEAEAGEEGAHGSELQAAVADQLDVDLLEARQRRPDGGRARFDEPSEHDAGSRPPRRPRSARRRPPP